MNTQKRKLFFQTIDSINRNQNNYMFNFVSGANKRAEAELKFEWEDKSLFDYIDLKFNLIKVSLRDLDKKEDNTRKLIEPINSLIKQFNNRQIDYYEFIAKFKQIEKNLLQASKSEKYTIYYDNFELIHTEYKTATITGVGGIGKSHFLWECQNKIQKENLYKSLFLYGKYFSDVKSVPWEDIEEYSNNKEFLLVIDGINEISDRNKRKYIYERIRRLSQCKHIRIFVSYRTYSLIEKIDNEAEDTYIDNLLTNKINFAGVDFDSSISEIVSNFKVDISYFYHILYCNNPMIIRMLIESDILNNQNLFDNLKDRSVVSVTFIYERFIKTACRKLWEKDSQTYWNTVKNLSKKLYDSNRNYFTRLDISAINIDTEKFINDLKNGGYIDTYDNVNYYFSWEQLSNYLIARSFNSDISGKSDDEICELFNNKSSKFPQISQFLLSVLIEKYHENFNKFIYFVSKTCPTFTEETLLNLTIKESKDREMLQEYIHCVDKMHFFTIFAGIPNRVYNCESFFFEYFCSLNVKYIKPNLYFNKTEIVRKLKNNLFNLNGKYFIVDNANEFIFFAILCLLISDKDITELSEKIIYDLIELYDNDFSNTILLVLEKCKSPLLKRSIYNIVCQLSSRKRQDYSKILSAIEKEKTFVNAKVLTNYCKFLNLSPYAYVNFKKTNLFMRYQRQIPRFKTNFNKYTILKGLINIIEIDRLFHSLKLEYFNNPQLALRLLDTPSRNSIIEFNNKVSRLVCQFNKCNCNIDVWDNMFDQTLENIIKPQIYPLINQEDLFFGFVAHLESTIKTFGIDENDIRWYSENRYREYKPYPDNVTAILNICVEEYIGSLMCNYFKDSLRISYWENKIYLGYAPIIYDEEQIQLYSPLQSYNATIERLENAVINRLNEYKRKKNVKWADNKNLSLSNIKKITKPYTIDGTEWVLLGCYIKNHTYYKKTKSGREYSEECIILHCATNYQKNKNLTLDSKLTIELQEYKGSPYDYKTINSDFCKNIKTIKDYGYNFGETNLVFPPSSIILYLGLVFDGKRATWIDSNGDDIIICNNGVYRNFLDNIGGTIFIKKEYFDKIKQDLDVFYYIYTDKLSYETGSYSDNSDMHIILKNNRITKNRKNSEFIKTDVKELHHKCSKCLIYNTFQEHQAEIKKSANKFVMFD